MGREMENKAAETAAQQFAFDGEIIGGGIYGSGHINDTYRLTCRLADGTERFYILQRMNKDIFKNPVELMENVVGVTSFLRKKIIAQGGDPNRETLNIIPTRDGGNYWVDEAGEYRRAYVYIDDTFSYDLVSKPDDFYQSALGLRQFPVPALRLPGGDAARRRSKDSMYIPGPDFRCLKKAVEEDVCGRAASVQEEIRFMLDRKQIPECWGICRRRENFRFALPTTIPS